MFNDEFEDHTAPEMTRRPVDDLVLQMKVNFTVCLFLAIRPIRSEPISNFVDV